MNMALIAAQVQWNSINSTEEDRTAAYRNTKHASPGMETVAKSKPCLAMTKKLVQVLQRVLTIGQMQG